MKFHDTLIEKLIKTYEVYSGWRDQSKLRDALQKINTALPEDFYNNLVVNGNSRILAKALGTPGSISEKISKAADLAIPVVKQRDKQDKAVKLYKEAFNKLETANKKDKNNPDILNYMGFTSRKSGNFNEAEKFYLKGLSLDPKHNGINEYLGELYVQTNRIEKAKERLAVLKNCNCKEFQELELIIKTRGSKIY